jgi:hypothetical protein
VALVSEIQVKGERKHSEVEEDLEASQAVVDEDLSMQPECLEVLAISEDHQSHQYWEQVEEVEDLHTFATSQNRQDRTYV